MASQHHTTRYAASVLLLGILLLATYLRLTNLTNNPGWFTDEGTHLDIARHLLEGHVQYLAVNQSTLLFAKLPTFDLLLAGLMRILGSKISTLRLLTGTLGVTSIISLFVTIRSIARKSKPGLALLAGLMMAIMPQAVLYSRFGFRYNLLAPLVPIIVLGLFHYLESQDRRWLTASSLLVGLGSLSDLFMLVFVVPLILVVSSRRGRDLPWSVGCALFPFFVLNIYMVATVPQAWGFDLRYTFLRLSGMTSLEQLGTLPQNVALLFLQDSWMSLGIVGLFVLRPIRLRNLCLLLFFVPLVMIGRSAAVTQLSAYYLIPLLPFIALGMAAFLYESIPAAASIFRTSMESLARAWGFSHLERITTAFGWGMALLLAGIPIGFTMLMEVENAKESFHTTIDPFLIDGIDAQKTANYLNANTLPEDVVIASPAVAWLLESHAADFQMAAAAEGEATPHLPGNIPPDRFAFDPRFHLAHYVVIDNLWRNWAGVNIPQVYAMMRELEKWNLVYSAGDIEVYENPLWKPTIPP